MTMSNSLNILMVVLLGICYLPSSFAQNDGKKGRPNIIIFLVDDMGYSDPGCYGGEIQTPNLDYLADNGLRFTDFHNTARCSPTRAALLTGAYQHQAGMSNIGHSLKTNVVTIAEVLQQGGYQTGMTGKWHLSVTDRLEDPEETNRWVGHMSDHGDFAPLSTYPVNRGFDEFYGVIWGVVNHFDPFSLVHNLDPIDEVPEGFHLTDFISEKSVDLIDEFNEKKDPFFLYVAYSAPHWPLHAKESDIDKYNGVYDIGWDSLRIKRYERMVEMGLFDPRTARLPSQEQNEGTSRLTPLKSNFDWKSYEHKAWEEKHMKVHAAMVDRVDQGIGKILDKLRETGELENTIIMFMSDNGASPERRDKLPGYHRTKYMRSGELMNWITSEEDVIAPGPDSTYGFLGRGWASAVNAPFRYWKAESFEGGTSTPFIVHWPNGIKPKGGTIIHQFGHVMDIMPTVLDIVDLDYPNRFNGNQIIPYSGKSFYSILKGRKDVEHESIFWEHAGGKAVRQGNWKISALRGGDWELFDLKYDRTETNNLAKYYPDKIKNMEKLWDDWYGMVTK